METEILVLRFSSLKEVFGCNRICSVWFRHLESAGYGLYQECPRSMEIERHSSSMMCSVLISVLLIARILLLLAIMGCTECYFCCHLSRRVSIYDLCSGQMLHN
jgi:hypothetical protein